MDLEQWRQNTDRCRQSSWSPRASNHCSEVVIKAVEKQIWNSESFQHHFLNEDFSVDINTHNPLLH